MVTVRFTGWITKWMLGALVASAAACGGSAGKGGAGAPTTAAESACAGTPVACGLLSAAQCASAAGCAPGACSGAAASCGGFSTTTECLLQEGCAPNGSGGACVGAPLACLAFSSDSACRAQRGCAWQEGCSGRAAACEALNATACLAQPGCHLAARAETDGGSPAEAGPPTRDCEDAGVLAELVIDDMEDRTQGILSSNAYGGWYVYADPTVGAHMTPIPGMPFMMEPIPGGRCASEYAMRLSGTGFTEWGAGMGFDFGYGDKTASGEVAKIAVDARRYSGVRLWARVGQATTTRATLSILAGTCPTPDAGDDGGAGGDAAATRAPSDCALPYTKNLTLTTDWVRYDIGFDTLALPPGGAPLPRDQVYSFQFLVPAATTFDLWIDDISWIPADPAP